MQSEVSFANAFIIAGGFLALMGLFVGAFCVWLIFRTSLTIKRMFTEAVEQVARTTNWVGGTAQTEVAARREMEREVKNLRASKDKLERSLMKLTPKERERVQQEYDLSLGIENEDEAVPNAGPIFESSLKP